MACNLKIYQSLVRSDFTWRFCESDLSRMPVTILSLICSSLTVFCQLVEVSNERFHCLSFLLNASIKACSLMNISLGYKVLIEFFSNFGVLLFAAFGERERFKAGGSRSCACMPCFDRGLRYKKKRTRSLQGSFSLFTELHKKIQPLLNYIIDGFIP